MAMCFWIDVEMCNFIVSCVALMTLRLLNMEGNVMACASGQSGMDVTTSAIAANVWRVYEKVGRVAFQQQNLSFISLDCEVRLVQTNYV